MAIIIKNSAGGGAGAAAYQNIANFLPIRLFSPKIVGVAETSQPFPEYESSPSLFLN